MFTPVREMDKSERETERQRKVVGSMMGETAECACSASWFKFFQLN